MWRKTSFLSLFLVLLLSFGVGAFPRVVIDQYERTVTIPREPLRIVSGAPSNTQILLDLGLAERIVGVTTFCPYEGAERVGPLIPLDLEKIISLQPDLFLAHRLNGKEIVDKLTALGIPTIALEGNTLAEIRDSVTIIGAAAGADEAAQRIVEKIDGDMAQAQLGRETLPVKDLKVFFIVGIEPLWIAGRDSYLHEMIELAGGRHAGADVPGAWSQFDVERLVALNPDVILTTQDPHVIYHHPQLRSLAAVQKGQVHRIDEDTYSQPVPGIFAGLAELT
ncbi:MAG: ABC transporter substrate-binding protein, partial [Limnochordia bacterium]